MIAVGIFLVVNGVLDLNLAGRSRHAVDLAIAIAGVVLGILVIAGVIR